jgi:hypothetical protein
VLPVLVLPVPVPVLLLVVVVVVGGVPVHTASWPSTVPAMIGCGPT